ncbi:hypothetical protein ACFW81_23940 [Streptomyces angustmyceticus]|uniref:hypothetical protein n=1 Tax=Streptomyces angustmyceticus TaxID=285578 RepID=UPI0036997B4E
MAAFAWCFDHGRLHQFDDNPWCTARWVSLPGDNGEDALDVKYERYGTAQFLHQLPDEQQVAVIRSKRGESA